MILKFGLAVLVCALVESAAAESSAVLAKYDGEEITFDHFAAVNPKMVTWLGMGLQADQLESALDAMIFNSLLAKEARSGNLDEDPDLALKIDRMLAGTYLKRAVPHELTVPTKAELLKYYNDNLDKYRRPERIRVSHILLPTMGDAHNVAAKLKSGESFAALARERSLDPASSHRDGSLGEVSPESLTPQLRDAIMPLKSGQQSEVVRSPFGYHILMVTDRPKPSFKPYQEVVAEVNSEASREKRQKLIDQLRTKLWKKYDVTIQKAELKELVEAPRAKMQDEHVVQAAEVQPPGTQPRLRLLSDEYDLGQVAVAPVIQTSLITNEGDADVIIRGVRSNCGGCLSGSVTPTRLAPGEVGRLTLKFNPNLITQKGPVQQLAFIESNDIDRPRRQLKVNANLIKK